MTALFDTVDNVGTLCDYCISTLLPFNSIWLSVELLKCLSLCSFSMLCPCWTFSLVPHRKWWEVMFFRRRYVGRYYVCEQLSGTSSSPIVTKLRESYPCPQGTRWLNFGRSRSKDKVDGEVCTLLNALLVCSENSHLGVKYPIYLGFCIAKVIKMSLVLVQLIIKAFFRQCKL